MTKLTKTAFGRLTIAKVKAAVAVDGITLVTGKDEYAFVGKMKTAPTEPTPTTPTTPTEPTPTVPTNPNPTPTPDGLDASAQVLYDGRDQVDGYVAQYPELAKLAGVPTAKWLAQWSGNIWSTTKDLVTAAKAAGNKTAQIVIYNIPNRDNGNYSQGGVANNDAYFAWIGAMADAIGDAPVIAILEPDALGLKNGMSASDLEKRYDAIHGAVAALKSKPNVKVYIDAPKWLGVDELAGLLKRVNLEKADGWSHNVSGYDTTENVEAYAEKLYKALGDAARGKGYVIDTSRNGNGEWANPNNEPDPWANPPERKIGHLPTFTNTTGEHCHAYLWIKTPGESDGNNRGWGSAGTFEPQLALNLISGK